ncbi:hypothetical protein DXG01_015787, partial [Tephrocybe rancida]
MSGLAPHEMIVTIKCLNGLIRETFEEGYPYQRLKGFYPIHIKKIPSWLEHVRSQDEKARDHPENEFKAWQMVLRSAAQKKLLPNPPDFDLSPATVNKSGAVPVPVAAPGAGSIPLPGPVVAPVTTAAPIAGAGAKVRTAMMSAAGNPGHSPSASKAKAK